MPCMLFKNLEINPILVNKLIEEKITSPSEIQEKVIPEILNKKDVLGIAETGSGKTLSFVLPILSMFKPSNESKNRNIDVLVLVPTRELAIQVSDVFKLYASVLPYDVKTLGVYGGVSINPQKKALYGTNVVVATPGRLLDLVESNALNLGFINTLVMDEADKILNMGFKDEMDHILRLLPAKRQNLLFSATLSKHLDGLKKVVLNNSVTINIPHKEQSNELINQLAYAVSDENKGPLLRYLIKTKELKQVLVFVSSIKRADNVANKLRVNGIDALPIHSKKNQGVRTDLLTKFKYGKLRVLVTTDLLARGIDIEFLPCVINYELPRSPKDYIHRIGRTGRAENPGQAISLITPNEQHHFNIIQKKTKKTIELIESKNLDLKGY